MAQSRERIDFQALKGSLLADARALVPQWLPDGRREGHEYKCAGTNGGKGASCSINLHTGAWADFATWQKLACMLAIAHHRAHGQRV